MEKHINGTLIPPRCVITCPFLKYIAYSHIRVAGAVLSGSTSDRDRQKVLLGSTSERKTLLVEAPPPPPPSNFIAGRSKAALFWFVGGFRCGVPLFIVMLVLY